MTNVLRIVKNRYGGSAKIVESSAKSLTIGVPPWERAVHSLSLDLSVINCVTTVMRHEASDEWRILIEDATDSRPFVQHAVLALRLELTQLSSSDLKQEVQAGIDILLRYGRV